MGPPPEKKPKRAKQVKTPKPKKDPKPKKPKKGKKSKKAAESSELSETPQMGDPGQTPQLETGTPERRRPQPSNHLPKVQAGGKERSLVTSFRDSSRPRRNIPALA